MSILKHLDKENLHHAYLIEGRRDEIVPEIIKFSEILGLKTVGNPDFCHIVIDNFKKEEAMELRAMSSNKSFSTFKKIFVICVNSFSPDAENILLKMFEEPIENTHFFLIVPDINALLKTLVSRFYLISHKSDSKEEIKKAEKFLSLSLKDRIEFIKERLVEPEEKDSKGNKMAVSDSTRSDALKFINALEAVISRKPLKNYSIACAEHIFKVREFLRMPGSSTKTLLESLALIIPIF